MRVWPQRSIAYLAGGSYRTWSPRSLDAGLGGSETAAVQLARCWHARGYQVSVYGTPGSDEGYHGGIAYLDHHRLDPRDRFDTLIVWRALSALDRTWHARRILLDLHDVVEPADLTPDRLATVTRVMLKSKFHRLLLPHVADEHVEVIPNGVDLALVPRQVTRDPHRLIYASAYNRGLEQMLTWGWPLIRREIPDATLDIYYGWQQLDALYAADHTYPAWKHRLQALLNQPGVREQGQVGQTALAQARATASVHWYGATYPEIDCISDRESAAAGTIPVTSSMGALAEKPYGVRIVGDPLAQRTQEEVAQAVVATLRGSERERQLLRQAGLAAAASETWQHVAERWLHIVESTP